jgi:cytochrome c oxidase subunit II
MGEEQRRRGFTRRDIPVVLAIGLIASAAGIALGLAIDWFPTQGSKQADHIDTLWDVLVIISVPVFVIVALTTCYSIYRFRVRPGEEELDGPPIHGNTRLEVIWTAIPAIIIAGLVIYAWSVLNDIEEAPADTRTEMRVVVTGEQFAWSFEYPGLGDKGGSIKSAQLYVPLGRSVKFDVKSKDVIHDFWVPAWRMKIDAVPGITTSYRITPTKLGTHSIVCAELCGLGHAFMRQTAHVLTPGSFQEWVGKQVLAAKAGAGGGAAGGTGNATGAVDAKKVFVEGNGTATACGACHTLAAAGTTGTTGPNLELALKAATKAEIKEDIVNPQAEITKGYAGGIMPPNYGTALSAAEIDALVNYLYDSAHGSR